MKEGGSIAVTEAVCLTHKIDISDRSKKVFVDTFKDAVKWVAVVVVVIAVIWSFVIDDAALVVSAKWNFL